jgi:hypothetical protein
MTSSLFANFSPDTFEQFARALALQVFGNGVTIFGNGPDGGREATFQGTVQYPSPAEAQWNGYGVIQAKFKEKLENTKADQTWVETQLVAELNTWNKSKTRKPKPEYFVYCTNVELSSGSGGGKDKLSEILNKHPGLKGFAIWDANQLSSFVDVHEGLRRRFGAFFATGDLLADIGKLITAHIPNPDSTFSLFLARTIQADDDAKLSQAGDRSEDRIRLAEVFYDLQVNQHNQRKRESVFDSSTEPVSALLELLHVGALKLDPKAMADSAQSHRRDPFIAGRYVLIGGPGSGKSTIGQFLCQIHRAAILKTRPSHLLEPRVNKIIGDIEERCAADSFPWPTVPRYPFRIELNAFAKALASGSVETLSEYLRKELSRDVSVPHQLLLDWLGNRPSLLVLDGLDEVPTSSNRADVVNAIRNFLGEARNAEADMLIIGSTRPEGYANEFDDDDVATRVMAPLNKDQAIACATRYINAKRATRQITEETAEENVKIIEQAVVNPLIERLLTSPLQVTFMVTVVIATGQPSESRWQLFTDYYRTIYERELQKAVDPYNKFLSDRRTDIDVIHHRVGFVVQQQGSRPGGTQADISTASFTEIVGECLEENGLDEEQHTFQRDQIVRAAELRLVFLTSRTPGRLSYDVRSLEEFMAANCLTNSGSIAEIFERLTSFASSAYWRNTFLFAVGKIFVDPFFREYRDRVRALCEDLNNDERLPPEVLLGSSVALDILESGVSSSHMGVTRSLTNNALRLLSISPIMSSPEVSRLALAYTKELQNEYQTHVRQWIGQMEQVRQQNAWLLVFLLDSRGFEWATELIRKHPQSEAKSIFLSFGAFIATQPDSLTEAQTELILKAMPATDPAAWLSVVHQSSPGVRESLGWGETEEDDPAFEEMLRVPLFDTKISLILPLETPFDALGQNVPRCLTSPIAHANWKLANAVQDFATAPTLTGFILSLGLLSDLDGEGQFDSLLPWPLYIGVTMNRADRTYLARVHEYSEQDFSNWFSTLSTSEESSLGGLFEDSEFGGAWPLLDRAWTTNDRESARGPDSKSLRAELVETIGGEISDAASALIKAKWSAIFGLLARYPHSFAELTVEIHNKLGLDRRLWPVVVKQTVTPEKLALYNLAGLTERVQITRFDSEAPSIENIQSLYSEYARNPELVGIYRLYLILTLRFRLPILVSPPLGGSRSLPEVNFLYSVLNYKRNQSPINLTELLRELADSGKETRFIFEELAECAEAIDAIVNAMVSAPPNRFDRQLIENYRRLQAQNVQFRPVTMLHPPLASNW